MLGSGRYAVTLTEWDGRILWQSTVGDTDSVKWSRELNEVTQATVHCFLPAGIVDLLEPWVHLLQVHRDDALVWEGIVLRVESSWNRVVVNASDAGLMFSRRRVPHDRVWRQHDASQVMQTMVEDAVGHRDPTGLTEAITARPSRVWVTAAWSAAECMVGDVVDDLVGMGLSWCVSAGRLLVGPVGSEYTTAQLSDRDFDNRMTVVKDGSEVVTDALVLGKGVWGQWSAVESPLGSVQALESADGAVRKAEAEEIARRLVADASVSPRRLLVPSGSRLMPDAPVSVEELVPGVLVPVASRQTGVLMASVMQLLKVEVSVDSGGEKVNVTLSEISVTHDAGELPDPADLDWRSPYERETANSQNTSTGSGAVTGEGQDEVAVPPA